MRARRPGALRGPVYRLVPIGRSAWSLERSQRASSGWFTTVQGVRWLARRTGGLSRASGGVTVKDHEQSPDVITVFPHL